MNNHQKRRIKRVLSRYILAIFGSMIFIFCCLSMVGCQTPLSGPAQDALTRVSSGAVYKYDITGSVNGSAFDGVGVIPYSADYKMDIVSKVEVDLLTVTSCHRDFSVESAIKLGWFQSKKGYSYDYNPSIGIENSGSCLVRIGAYNRDKGQNAWGIIDFETPEATLPATNYCNGASIKANGVSICQSKTGLIQRIVFDVPVTTAQVSLDSKCHMTSKDQMTWEYQLPAGECVIAFRELAAPNRIHRHTTVAYTDVLIRGNQ